MVSPEKIMHLKTLISKNEINHVFNEMDAVLDALPMHHDLLVIQSNYSDLKKKEKAGALSFEHLNLGFNGIKYNLLELIEKVSNLPENLREVKEFSASIRQSMDHLNTKVESLTNDQFRIIQHLRNLKKVRISGCAGSGKTLVAAEKSIRLANAGIRTLFLCHNPLLASHLENLTQGSTVKVYSFGDWINRINQQYQMLAPTNWSKYVEPTPEDLEKAFEKIEQQNIKYDAIIVDEAQDFRGDWWTIVEATLEETGILYLFHDDNQALLPFRTGYPIEDPVIDLSRNCRNGGKIFEFMRSLFHRQAPKASEEIANEGEVKIFEYENEHLQQRLTEAVSWLVNTHDSAKTVILLAGAMYAADWKIENLSLKIPMGEDWQREVRKKFSEAIRVSKETIPPGDKDYLSTQFSKLSNEKIPTEADITLVRELAEKFTLKVSTGKKVDSDPNRKNRFYWANVNGKIKLFHKRRDLNVWAYEIIQFFRNPHWDKGIYEEKQVQIGNEMIFKENYFPVLDTSTFKGLEADGVILIVFENKPELFKQMYVGVSRAKAALAIMTDRMNRGYFSRHLY